MTRFLMTRLFKNSVECFGFWDALKFTIKWDVTDKIRMWWWQTFKTRKWCTSAGWYCTKGKECPYIHYSKPNVTYLGRLRKLDKYKPFSMEEFEESAKIEHFIKKKGKKWTKNLKG